jgi:hypothetical protein
MSEAERRAAAHEQASDPVAHRTASRTVSPRRWVAPLLVVAAVTGLAAGSGVSPGDVVEWVRDVVSQDPTPDVERSVLVASDSTPTDAVELWTGPATSGSSSCSFVRVTWDLGREETAQKCSKTLVPWEDADFRVVRVADYFDSVIETPIGSMTDGYRSVALTGLVHPDVTAITARFGDGSEYSFVPRADGWFAVVLPPEVTDMDRTDGHLVNVLVELRLFGDDGGVLTTVDVPAWRLSRRSP